MSTLAEIADAVRNLSLREQAELRELLDNILEDQLEMTDEFKASIAKGEAELAAGLGQVRKP